MMSLSSLLLQIESRLAKFQYLCLLDIIEENSVLEEELKSLKLQVNVKGEDIKDKNQEMGTMKTEIKKFQTNLVQLQVGDELLHRTKEGALPVQLQKLEFVLCCPFTVLVLFGVSMLQQHLCDLTGRKRRLQCSAEAMQYHDILPASWNFCAEEWERQDEDTNISENLHTWLLFTLRVIKCSMVEETPML